MFLYKDNRDHEVRIDARIVVVKVGSNVLCNPAGRLDARYIGRLSGVICDLMDRGVGVVLVSSGAIAAGLGMMGLGPQPRSIPENQALAAIGQSRLMQVYGRAFERRGRQVGQALLTSADMEDRRRYLNSRRAIETLLSMGVVPIINENDSTVVEEIKFGGNDVLSAIVATKMNADLLILLTNVKGLYSDNPSEHPEARLIELVERGAPQADEARTEGRSALGTGGMTSKVAAARMATEAGVYVAIADGRAPAVLRGISQGRLTGTLFVANREHRQTGWRRWILAAHRQRDVRIEVDAGAARALTEGKKSLLPAGVRAVGGAFQQGDVVDVFDPDGIRVARGLVNYSCEEIDRIKGLRSDRIADTLGYCLEPTIIHRDNMVTFD